MYESYNDNHHQNEAVKVDAGSSEHYCRVNHHHFNEVCGMITYETVNTSTLLWFWQKYS